MTRHGRGRKNPADCSPADLVYNTPPTQILAAYRQDNPNKPRNYLQILEASILKKKEVCDDEKKLAYTARFRRISNKQKKILASLSGMSVTAGTSVPIKQKKNTQNLCLQPIPRLE